MVLPHPVACCSPPEGGGGSLGIGNQLIVAIAGRFWNLHARWAT